MAESTESILLRMGFDATAVTNGTKAMLEHQKHTANEVKKYWKESFSEIGRDVLAGFSAGAIIGKLESVFEKAKSLRAGAEKTGLDVVDFQQLSTTANEELPEGAEKLEAALTKINVKLGQGSTLFEKWGITADNAKDALYQIADKMHETEDPAKRSAMAFDLMGRTGTNLIPLLERGAAALKQMSGSKLAWNAADLKAIEDAHQNLEKTNNNITISLGWIAAKFMGAADALGRFSAGPSTWSGDIKERSHQEFEAILAADSKKVLDADAVAAAKEKAKAEEASAAATEKARAATVAAKDAAESKVEIEKETLKIQKQTAELNNRLTTLYRERERIISSANKVGQETPTLEMLAGREQTDHINQLYGKGGQYDLEAGDGPFAQIAQQAELLKKQQMWDIVHGNAQFDTNGGLVGGQAYADKQRLKSLENMLGAAGLETPAQQMSAIKEQLDQVNLNIVGLRQTAAEDGIVLKDKS